MKASQFPRLIFFIFVSVAIFSVTSCKKENTAQQPSTETPSTTARLKYRAEFEATSGINIKGFAKIFLNNNLYQLSLDSFSVTNGPDLKVYLSKEYPAVNFINLGALKSTSGSQLYEIPGMPNFMEYKYVLIHCKQYNHLFGYAALKP